MTANAIFLSYASQDADAARRICDALRVAGLEVWFDQSELRGGDAWDASIRKQVKECALFVPLISANTQARPEGYFRLEWRLGDQRTHLIAKGIPFLLPVVIDVTSDKGALVPDSFLEVQWTRLAHDDVAALENFAGRVAKLVDRSASLSTKAPNAAPIGELRDTVAPTLRQAQDRPVVDRIGTQVQPSSQGHATLDPDLHRDDSVKGVPGSSDRSPQGAQRIAGPTSTESPTRIALRSMTGYKTAIITLCVIAIVSVGITLTTQKKSAPAPTTDASKPGAINPLSVMVMPFANQTGDTQKTYIADALTSSITSDLTRIRDAFIVPAATAFSLRDKQLTVPQLGKEAAVRFVLTGSVTGDKEKLRVNAVLSDTQTGAQLWTENFDGKQTDLFALQDQVTTRIGNSIGPQMVIVAARESEKRANKPQVADLLMRAKALGLNQQSLKNHQAMEALYRASLALEPNNLNTKIGLAISLSLQAANFANELKLDKTGRIALAKQGADLAQEVKRADPISGDVYFCIALFANLTGDHVGAVQAVKRRVELDSKNAGAYQQLGVLLWRMGDIPGARAALEKALQFVSPARRPAEIYRNLSRVAFVEDRADEAIKWAQEAIEANPELSGSHAQLAVALARKGDQVRARKAAAEAVRLNPNLTLDIKDEIPWPGKEAAYRKYIETQYLPAWRLAGLPE